MADAPTLPASVLDLRRVVPSTLGVDPWGIGWNHGGMYEDGSEFAEEPEWWAPFPSHPIVPLAFPAARLAVLVAVARVLWPGVDEDGLWLRLSQRWSRKFWVLGSATVEMATFHDLGPGASTAKLVAPVLVPGISHMPYTGALRAIGLAVEARR